MARQETHPSGSFHPMKSAPERSCMQAPAGMQLQHTADVQSGSRVLGAQACSGQIGAQLNPAFAACKQPASGGAVPNSLGYGSCGSGPYPPPVSKLGAVETDKGLGPCIASAGLKRVHQRYTRQSLKP